MIVRPAVLALCCALVGAASAYAQAEFTVPVECHYADHDCARRVGGLAPVTEYAAARRDLIRLVGWSGFGPLRVILEFRKAADGTPQILLADVNDPTRQWLKPLAAKDWRAATAAVRHFRWSATHLPPSRPKQASGIVPACVWTDRPAYHAEIALDGLTEYADSGDGETADGCFDPIDDLSRTLMAIAIRALPACGLLAEDYAPSKLFECARLGGDRTIAAAIANRVRPLDNDACDGKGGDWNHAGSLFADDSHLAIGGVPPASGANAGAKAFIALICGEGVEGMALLAVDGGDDAGVVRGFVRRGRNLAHGKGGMPITVYRDAPFAQRWARSPDGQWRIVDWTVGPYGPEIKVEPDQ